MLFENVIAQSSWTRPSIGSMITSLYPRSLGIYKERFDILPDDHWTLAEILQANGYRTVGITANPNINTVFNFHQGFEDYEDSSVIWPWMMPEQNKKKRDRESGVHLPKSKEIFDRILGKAELLGPGPAYVQINVMEVHSPRLVREEYLTLFQNYPVRGEHGYMSQKQLVRRVTGTYRAVRQISHDIGEFLNRIRSLPGWSNTLLVITSDHGQGLDDHLSTLAKIISHSWMDAMCSSTSAAKWVV